MGKISILPDALCNQIAAGEVIERPAAVVKELMENSIDAGSRKISISLDQGGRREIRVVDNGAGMDRDDALLALERHATSKIRSLEDLQSVQSLGFRGEALPSIASVSRFELVTRPDDQVSGAYIRMEGGILRDIQEKGCPSGTMITVRDLFFNIPVRRKFLRSVDTEMGHINDQFIRLALAHCSIHFQLSHQDRMLYQYPAVEDPLHRAGQVLGADLVRRLKPFSAENASLRLHGYAGLPDLQRPTGQSVFAYLNGRPIWDRLVTRSILSAYELLLPRGKFPVVLLFMELSPTLVDVNVHPTKREVRFRSPGEVMETLRTAIRQALRNDPAEGPAVSMKRPPPVHGTLVFPTSAGPSIQGAVRDEVHDASPGLDSGEGPAPMKGGARFSDLRILGQIANSYIILESRGGMVIIDQHAAHERIIYDRLNAGSGGTSSQRLLRSVVVELLPRQAALLQKWMQSLKNIGFDLEPFGGSTFVIHAVPAVLSRVSPDGLIRELLETAHEDAGDPRWDLLAEITKSTACHEAMKAGQKLSLDEIRYLLEALDLTPFPSTCPHGRPLWTEIGRHEMAQRFQRK